MTDIAFVRSEISAAEPAPRREAGAWAWLRKNLFASVSDTILTVLAMLFLLWIIPPLYGFLIGNAVPPGGTVEQCRVENVGACWAYIASEIEFFIYGFYPMAEYWRPNLVFALFALLIVPLLWPRVPFKALNAFLFFVPFPIVSIILLAGGMFGLRYVPTEMWGGLLVTLIISVVGICVSLPLGHPAGTRPAVEAADHQVALASASSKWSARCR